MRFLGSNQHRRTQRTQRCEPHRDPQNIAVRSNERLSHRASFTLIVGLDSPSFARCLSIACRSLAGKGSANLSLQRAIAPALRPFGSIRRDHQDAAILRYFTQDTSSAKKSLGDYGNSP
jgi:hypothetical protein